MPESILKETKLLIGLNENDPTYDTDARIHINSTFSTLNQIGLGPDDGFRIADDSQVWTDFLPEGPLLDMVKDYVFMKVKYVFDPPGTGYHTTAMAEVIKEFETRLSYAREETDWVPADPETPLDIEDPFGDPIILDGG